MPHHLADVNVLVALATADHVHSAAAHTWFASLPEGDRVATCAATQAGLMRFVVRSGQPWAAGVDFLSDLAATRHEFWPDDVRMSDVDGRRIVGHAQVTDAHLAQLARRRGGRVATFDRGLAAVHRDVAALVPT